MENNQSYTADPATDAPKRKYHIVRSIADFSAPAGSIDKLSQQEKVVNLNRAMTILMQWPSWEIWPFKLAIPAVALTAAAPGYMLNSAFRNSLLLGHYARTSSYLVCTGIPFAISGLLHKLFITADILEQKTTCPVCLQVKSASLQLAAATIYPTILVPIANFSIAGGMKNLYFPKIHKQPREVLNYARDVFRSVKDRYLMLAALQVVVAMGVTYLEQQCYANTLLPILRGEKTVSKK